MSPDSKIIVNLWNCLGGSVLSPQDFGVSFSVFLTIIFDLFYFYFLFNLFQFLKVYLKKNIFVF